MLEVFILVGGLASTNHHLGTNKLKCRKNPHWVPTCPKTSAECHFLAEL